LKVQRAAAWSLSAGDTDMTTTPIQTNDADEAEAAIMAEIENLRTDGGPGANEAADCLANFLTLAGDESLGRLRAMMRADFGAE
jgi:hypothetical protein